MKRTVLILLFVAAVAASIAVFAAIERVPEDSVAVRFDGEGYPKTEWGPGVHWRLPGTGTTVVYPTKTLSFRFPSETSPAYRLFDAENEPLDIDFEIAYRVVPGRARALADEVGAGLRDTLIARLERHTRPLAAERSAADPSTPEILARSLRGRVNLTGAEITVRAVAGDGGAGTGLDVLILGIDAGDWKVIDPLLERGALPHLKSLLDRGVRADLNSMQPMLSPLLWTTIATGTTPDRHGILDFLTVDPATGERIPTTRRQRGEPAFWNALTQFGIEHAVIGWLATWPAETVSGHMITDRFGFLAFAESASPASEEGMTWPPDYVREARALETRVSDRPAAFWKRFVDVSEGELAALGDAAGFDKGDRLKNFALTVNTALTTTRIAEDLATRHSPRVIAVYYEMVDAVGHLAMPFAPPKRPDIPDDGFRRYKNTMDESYVLQDELVGRLLAHATDRTVVLVVSDHGFKSGTDRPAGSAEIHGGEAARWHREPGILLLAGPGIRRGVRLPEPVELIDVAPTLHAVLGLPIPSSMTGRVVDEAFSEDGRARYTPKRVAEIAWRPEVWKPPAPADSGTRTAAATASRHNNLGLVHQENGRLDEAEAEFRKALAAVPKDRLARTNLGGILLNAGRLAEAEPILERVVNDYPDNTPALFNLGMLYQRSDRFADAARMFERTLEQDPAHPKVRVHLGEVYLREQRTVEAETVLRDALSRSPDEPRVHFGMGLAATQRGDYAAAAVSFRRVLELDPGHRGAIANLAAVERALKGN